MHPETKELVSTEQWKSMDKAQRSTYLTSSIYDWVSKSYTVASDYDRNVMMVIPAAVDTSHWHDFIWPASRLICFLKGRVKFTLPGKAAQSSTVPTAVVLFSKDPKIINAFWVNFEDLGKVVLP